MFTHRLRLTAPNGMRQMSTAASLRRALPPGMDPRAKGALRWARLSQNRCLWQISLGRFWFRKRICSLFNKLRGSSWRNCLCKCDGHKRKKRASLLSKFCTRKYGEWISRRKKNNPFGCFQLTGVKQLVMVSHLFIFQ